MTTRRITVDYMARVEGEGSLDLHIEGERVVAARLGIFEPPRFFEAFLRGRGFAETPDIVARICGICPVAYQMSAVHALENAFGVRVEGQLRALRRLLYCGEWIESHALHVVMLHAPDFLGYPDAIRMAAEHGERVRGALALKKAGNSIIRLLGGREIHPVNVRVGGSGDVSLVKAMLNMLPKPKVKAPSSPFPMMTQPRARDRRLCAALGHVRATTARFKDPVVGPTLRMSPRDHKPARVAG